MPVLIGVSFGGIFSSRNGRTYQSKEKVIIILVKSNAEFPIDSN
jgi:hypothetical protein